MVEVVVAVQVEEVEEVEEAVEEQEGQAASALLVGPSPPQRTVRVQRSSVPFLLVHHLLVAPREVPQGRISTAQSALSSRLVRKSVFTNYRCESRAYGSGYPGVAGRGVGGLNFPFFFWPVTFVGVGGIYGASYYHNHEVCREELESFKFETNWFVFCSMEGPIMVLVQEEEKRLLLSQRVGTTERPSG